LASRIHYRWTGWTLTEYQRLAMEQGKIAQVIGLARQRMS